MDSTYLSRNNIKNVSRYFEPKQIIIVEKDCEDKFEIDNQFVKAKKSPRNFYGSKYVNGRISELQMKIEFWLKFKILQKYGATTIRTFTTIVPNHWSRKCLEWRRSLQCFTAGRWSRKTILAVVRYILQTSIWILGLVRKTFAIVSVPTNRFVDWSGNTSILIR